MVRSYVRRRLYSRAGSVTGEPVLYTIHTPIDYHASARFVAIARSPEEARQKIIDYIESRTTDDLDLEYYSSSRLNVELDYEDTDEDNRKRKDALIKMVKEADVVFTELGPSPKNIETDEWPTRPSGVTFFEGAND